MNLIFTKKLNLPFTNGTINHTFQGRSLTWHNGLDLIFSCLILNYDILNEYIRNEIKKQENKKQENEL